MQFPDDANGDVLRRMAADGADLSREYDIDFFHLFATEPQAKQMRRRVAREGGEADVGPNEEAGGWDCRCVVRMVPTHAAITATESRLDAVARDCGGAADGWGLMQE